MDDRVVAGPISFMRQTRAHVASVPSSCCSKSCPSSGTCAAQSASIGSSPAGDPG